MKTSHVLLTALLLEASQGVQAQNCDDYISQGRGFLAATNLTAANSCFSNAVVLCPGDQTGNVFYAATRLLIWPSSAAGSNFLNRLGVPSAGRYIYNWTAQFPRDTNGVPQLPAGVDAAEFTALLRTNFLAELIGAEANLAKVTDTNFTLSLTGNETRTVTVALDYGDIRLLRAMLQAAEYFSYTVYSWNLDVQWAALCSLRTNSQYTVERLLEDHPSLLTFATTDDLNAAKLAFQNAADYYFEASQFIRSRSTNVVRLFNYAPDEAAKEQEFRWTLADLTNSLTLVVPLTVDPTYSIYLGSHFSGVHTPRSFLPLIRGNGFGLGTFPDLTFGGLVYGVHASPADDFFAKALTPIPCIAAIFNSQDQPFGLQINGLSGRGYVVQVATNLINWSDYAAFVSLGGGYDFVDPLAQNLPRRFYRVVERPLSQLPPPTNDNFANRIPLSGLGITATGYTVNASKEPGEPGNWPATIWYSWTAPADGYVVALAVGNDWYPYPNVYTGSSLSNLAQVNGAAPHPNQSYNGFPFYATAGTTYQIQVGAWWGAGGIELAITSPPDLIVSRPLDGTVFLTTTNITISAFSTDPDGTISVIECEGDGQWLGASASGTLSLVWTNVGPGVHLIEVRAKDNLGVTTLESLRVTVRPPNDDFANRLPIVGAPAVVTGTNSGASKEPGEPNHAGNSGGSSVWWSWVSPFTGAVTISADLFAPYGYSLYPLLGVYTGTSVSNLITVASNTPAGYGDYRAQASFAATAGVAYQIAVDGVSGQGGYLTLRIISTQPPAVTITSPTNGARFVTASSTNVPITVTANDSDGSIARVDFYVGSFLNPISTLTSSPYSLVWSNVGVGSYTLLARATDNSAVSTLAAPVSITVAALPPPNDNFANRATLSGANVTVTGSNAGASREPGEPNHAGYYGGKSVWWAWTAPSNGTFRVTCTTGAVYYPVLAVYTGIQLSTLSSVTSTRGSSFTAQVSFSALGGQAYQIALDDYYGNGGSYSLTISPY